jgi:phosphate transport system substrate-binding protein
VAIKVDKSGTGGGFKNFVQGTLDICDASRPIQESEMQQCKANGVEYIELPVCFDALTVAVNEKNNWCKDLTVAELQKLWAPDSKVSKWNEIRPDWPDAKITLFARLAREHSNTSPRRSSAKRTPAAATTRRAKTTT